MHLIIAEKHIAAKRIAAILAPKKPKQVRVSGVDTYEYGIDAGKTIFMGLSGHIVGVDFPKTYNNWQKVDARLLIDAEIISTPTQVKIVSALKKLGKIATKITIATDYDREGELIGAEALEIIQKVNPDVSYDRVHYSAITPKAINEAFANPVSVDFDLADAGHSRQVIDLIWGAALTRYVSISAGRLGRMFLSVGRVQSPTLTIIVDREKERDAFISKPYWEIFATLSDQNGETFLVQHKTSRFWDQQEADSILAKLDIGNDAVISSVVKSKKIDKVPTPFNTTEFIGAASSIGFSAANSMRIAEFLYTSGFISYPRTDNTVYPESVDMRAQIELFKASSFKQYAEQLLKNKKLVPTRGKKETTDHPPIFPASLANKSELKEDEWKVYELIVRRFFATFADPAEWETMRVKFDINGEQFKVNGARLTVPGWRWYYPYNAPEDRLLPVLQEGDRLTVRETEMIDKETKPPSRYGQGRLIRIMDELGLGTKATRHDIISKLYSRAYVHGNPLQPTKTAYAVVEALGEYASTITKPDMTSKLEEDMDRIAVGSVKEDDVIKESREMLDSVFSELEKNKDNISESLRTGLREDKVVGTCKKCGSQLMVRRSKRGSRFIGCEGYPDCNFSLPLPKSGQVIVTDKLCEEHGLYHIRIITPGRRPWNLGCPNCNFIEWQASQEAEKAKRPKTPRPDRIADITGIGKVTVQKLSGAGIVNVDELIEADAFELSKTTGISIKKIKGWQDSIL
ncbi:MAG TPA: DNA topoisomerase I [Methanosarcinaceae archaeon]|nr:DNA topoisomerase I [Methanosarcinaceae archaeon]